MPQLLLPQLSQTCLPVVETPVSKRQEPHAPTAATTLNAPLPSFAYPLFPDHRAGQTILYAPTNPNYISPQPYPAIPSYSPYLPLYACHH
ncbi:hypothetical protein K438DRAFT_1838169 [Mycena galopus ATCC 62051]|nr:hypothetical protein K438DRAFT_1838169 [Mycena galopus ATCC 62051]